MLVENFEHYKLQPTNQNLIKDLNILSKQIRFIIYKAVSISVIILQCPLPPKIEYLVFKKKL